MSDHTSAADLPLTDDDHLPLGDLTHRIRSLDAGGLEALLQYEREHGDRLPAVQGRRTATRRTRRNPAEGLPRQDLPAPPASSRTAAVKAAERRS